MQRLKTKERESFASEYLGESAEGSTAKIYLRLNSQSRVHAPVRVSVLEV